MREIKFRAWDIENKVMCDVSHIFIANMVIPQTIMVSVGSEMKHCPDDAILMQFTGLLDRHSKEIFEGDVVKTVLMGDEIIGTVKYGEKWGCFYLAVTNKHGVQVALDSVFGWLYADDAEEIVAEVIGNIYEHPEMLKEA